MTEPSPPEAGDQEESGGLTRAISKNVLLLLVVGDVLGAGIYALVGEVGGRVGGAIWAAFLFALVLAVLTAFAYAELVDQVPAGRRRRALRQQGVERPFLTFLVAFAVMCSGLTSARHLCRAPSAATTSPTFVDAPDGARGLVLPARGRRDQLPGHLRERPAQRGAHHHRGDRPAARPRSIGMAAIVDGGGSVDAGRALEFKDGERRDRRPCSAAPASPSTRSSASRTRSTWPRRRRNPAATTRGRCSAACSLAGAIYLAVTVVARCVVPTERARRLHRARCSRWSRSAGLAFPPGLFAVIALFALANGALINMIMASRLVYGMSSEGILPARPRPGATAAATRRSRHRRHHRLAMALVASGDLAGLADTTVLLLLLVFAVVNVAVLVLRARPGRPRPLPRPDRRCR